MKYTDAYIKIMLLWARLFWGILIFSRISLALITGKTVLALGGISPMLAAFVLVYM